MPDVQLRLASCQPATLSGLLVRYRQGRWHLEAQALTLDATCLRQWPASSAMTAPQLAQWQQWLPETELILHHVALTPWLPEAGSLHLSTDASRQQLRIQSDQLQVQAELRGAELTLHQGLMRTAPQETPLQINGAMHLAPTLNRLPQRGGGARRWVTITVTGTGQCSVALAGESGRVDGQCGVNGRTAADAAVADK
ncbi:hypothetical protein OS31_33590 [Dickeya oryzae]